ncbi:MAG: hypothetical protein JKY60_19065, partial [Kordiimonadaceae bacterium]|nr:hypothetical protein [Kordiimonadaceae bacterium]
MINDSTASAPCELENKVMLESLYFPTGKGNARYFSEIINRSMDAILSINGDHRVVLADDPLVDPVLHLQELALLGFPELV